MDTSVHGQPIKIHRRALVLTAADSAASAVRRRLPIARSSTHARRRPANAAWYCNQSVKFYCGVLQAKGLGAREQLAIWHGKLFEEMFG
ncbi:unnamed protein product [Urochloa humidicola]